ncbi:MAG: triose-phosphate isomerase family protein [Oscillospiraceae bacterium]
MKYIFLNLKRFDVPVELGGVNRGDIHTWARDTVVSTSSQLSTDREVTYVAFFPEAHLMAATKAATRCVTPMKIGCQSVFRSDVKKGENFGALTSNRPAAAMRALGVSWAIIGHCEERKDKRDTLIEGGATDMKAVDRQLNAQIKCAISQNLSVLYCIGETLEEQPRRFEVLENQMKLGLEGTDISKVAIAYEPVWAIGPGKTPPGREYIAETAAFIKKICDVPVVYGGGLKSDNAEMLASIEEVDGGLIALTRFSGDIGFYPDEYCEIARVYLSAKNTNCAVHSISKSVEYD